ncbi:MAG: serine hydrolase domain-containing protein, partial [Ginsengibacter sp.]
DYSFRTGSMTKPFTAAIVLQLMEEGRLNIRDLYFDLINRETKNILSRMHLFNKVDCSDKISVLHLLQHRSGLCDYFADDERFSAYVMKHPSQSWNWKLVMEKYFEMGLYNKTAFKPGDGFHYSDTNYLLLAVLIEQLTGKPLHQVFDERIIKPLGLDNTYLEFYQSPKKPLPVVFPYYAIHSLKNVNTSFDWGSGGLISTMKDLDTFIRSLLKGHLFKKEETLSLLLEFNNTIAGNKSRIPLYGLGIQKKEIQSYSFIGHNSSYGSMMFYDPKQNISIVLSLNQAAAFHKAEWLMNKVVKELLANSESTL